LTKAAKLGKTVAEAGKGTKIGTTLGEIVDRIVAIGDDVAARASEEYVPLEKPAKQSLLGKLGGFRSMIPKKSKAKAG